MTQDQMRAWIDQASYEELLRKWRFAPLGDPFFQGEIGDYYTKVMGEKRAALVQSDTAPRVLGDAASDVSKKIGWEQ